MLTLNLLPEEQKRQIRLECAFRKILFLGVGVIVILIIFIGFSFGTKIILKSRLGDLEKKMEAQLVSQELLQIKEKEAEINKFNFLLSDINEINKLKVHWSRALIEIAEIIPEGVRIEQIQINREAHPMGDHPKGEKISINGFSPTRKKVLTIKDRLEKSLLFKDVYSAPSNLVKKEDIDFFFSFYLK